MNVLLEKYNELKNRNRNLDIDPVLGFQAEYYMIRIEKFLRNGPAYFCTTCGSQIPEERLKICPETQWCTKCVDEYEKRRGKPWKRIKNFGKRL